MGLFGGGTNQSSAQAQGESGSSINSSGWVIGKGNATGGKLDIGSLGGFPWYVWGSFALIGAAWWHYKIKKG